MLFVLVEGDDDERFFESVIKPLLEGIYISVRLWKYAQQNTKKIDSLLTSVKAMGGECIFMADINTAPCVTAKKERIRAQLRNVTEDRIVVVIKEIESWYVAGIDARNSQKLGIRFWQTTDEVTKEHFDNSIPKKFDSRIDFMVEILKCFSIETAKRKNRSFSYFLQKYLSDF